MCSQIWSHLTRLYSPRISQACLNLVLLTLNVLMSMHFLQHWSPAWCAWLSALLVVCFETIVPANSRSFCLSPQLFLGSWTTPLTIFFSLLCLKPCKEQGCGRCQFIIKRCSFHFWIMVPMVLTGIFSNIPLSQCQQHFCNNKVPRVL